MMNETTSTGGYAGYKLKNNNEYLTPTSRTPVQNTNHGEEVKPPVSCGRAPGTTHYHGKTTTVRNLNHEIRGVRLPGLTPEERSLTLPRRSNPTINKPEIPILPPPPSLPPMLPSTPPPKPPPRRQQDQFTLNEQRRNPDVHRAESSVSSSSLSSYTSNQSQKSSNSTMDTHGSFELNIIDSELEKYNWFYGNINRKDAEDLLTQYNKNGAYLVRHKQDRSPTIPFTLSVFYKKVYHLEIRYLPNENTYALGREKPDERKFNEISSLIRVYTHDEPLQLIRYEDSALSASTKLTGSPPKKLTIKMYKV